MATTKETVQQDTLLQQLVTYRRALHEHPELSMKEYETTAKIKNWLTEADITILDYGLEVGVIAEVVGDKPGPTIALRADIDALPIIEQTDLSFASKINGVMHACGHDFHTASIIGAALLLQQRKSELKGAVRFIFQPAEEIAEGAKYVEQAGALEGVEAIFGMHNKPDLAVGTIGVREGALMASVDRFKIEINGVGGHAGIPNNSIDPIVVAGQVITALQTIVSRNLKAFDNAVISITKVHAGTAWNVIPEKAVLEGTVRIFQKDVREKVPQRMKEISEGIASSFGATAIFKWYPSVSSVNNSPLFTAVIAETANDLGLQVVNAEQSPAGEDFAYYQEKVPGYFVWMGVDGPQEWHHPSFTLDEEALLVSANYFSALSVNVLKQLVK
ncbi:MAG: amidohydrolase [Solibacillus sp.]